MKKIIPILFALMITAAVHAEPPTTESIEKLLKVAQVEKLLANMQVQMQAAVKGGMDRAFQGKGQTDEDKAKIAAVQEKITQSMAEELSWPKMKELYIQVYSETFTQEEIDGLTAFYETPTGQAFITKMPDVMQKTMVLMQQRIGPMMQKMQQSIQDSVKDIDAAKSKPAQ